MGSRRIRWSFCRDRRDLFPDFGFALVTNGGCSGSTYGEPGRDMSRVFYLTFLWWTWRLMFVWKQD